MNKPLKDWTLGEIMVECEKHAGYCKADVCPFFTVDTGDCKIKEICRIYPRFWILSEPPRWTEQNKEDAKALKRLVADAHHVWRYSAESEPQLYDEYETGGLPLNDCFAALPPRTNITLDEIIGGGE